MNVQQIDRLKKQFDYDYEITSRQLVYNRLMRDALVDLDGLSDYVNARKEGWNFKVLMRQIGDDAFTLTDWKKKDATSADKLDLISK